ncbi:hypothetical protein BRYFOR_07887 [Marvinbryantia formatexigens DSM 14469]|uniref:Uncharacterized protein n=1 Tax=Marvinbryantia formatexigens DSM 14469 TaxID=478749 RepID=C6LGX6_9FIRM|nr:hypothetical protein BRYFOR_07887 [Marvinbryantia formatexigens DSM 14469]
MYFRTLSQSLQSLLHLHPCIPNICKPVIQSISGNLNSENVNSAG